MPQFSAIMNVAEALKGSGVPLIADGGIRYSGDIVKALAAGANSIMAGGLLQEQKKHLAIQLFLMVENSKFIEEWAL